MRTEQENVWDANGFVLVCCDDYRTKWKLIGCCYKDEANSECNAWKHIKCFGTDEVKNIETDNAASIEKFIWYCDSHSAHVTTAATNSIKKLEKH